jgi:hypothetical protein
MDGVRTHHMQTPSCPLFTLAAHAPFRLPDAPDFVANRSQGQYPAIFEPKSLANIWVVVPSVYTCTSRMAGK